MKYSQYVKQGLLAWTLTSNGYKYLTWNFYLHWKSSCPNQPICIICADKPSYSFFQREGVPCILWDQTLADYGPDICPFGSRTFSSLNRLKLTLLHMFSQDASIESCIYIDGDICVYKNMVADLVERLESVPFWMQCDEHSADCTGPPCPMLCSGLIAWHHGSDGGCFKLDNEPLWLEKPEDQVWINRKIRETGLQVAALPRDLYPNGARCQKTKTDPLLRDKAICLHYNYRVGASKKADMKRFGDWRLPY